MGVPGSLQVQTVLYGHRPRVVERWLAAVLAAAGRARAAGLVGAVAVSIGDCTVPPALDQAAIRRLGASAAAGSAAFSHEELGANLGSAGGHNRLFAAAPAPPAALPPPATLSPPTLPPPARPPPASRPDWFLVLNPDATTSPGCIAALVSAMEDPTVGMADARQVPFEHPKAYDLATGDTSWASGTCCLVRREVVDQTGGFDADTFFLHGDDVDLSWRARILGWRVRNVPWATVFHDKRVHPDGAMVAPAVETAQAAWIALALPHKYGRPELVAERLAEFRASPLPAQREAAAEFDARRAAGRLPRPIEGATAVAVFRGDHYGDHRFGDEEARLGPPV
ncbi:MAG: glycosyltransferase [Acidimicrobiales bacterium]